MLSSGASLSASFSIKESKPCQSRIITENELVSYTEDRWEIVKELSKKRFLVKKPNHTTN